MFLTKRKCSRRSTRSPSAPVLSQVREDLLSIYVASRLMILTYFILYAAFSVARDDGWGYQLYLMAWVLSLFAQFKSFVSVFWLAVTTGVFLQGIGVSYSLFLVCHLAASFSTICFSFQSAAPSVR